MTKLNLESVPIQPLFKEEQDPVLLKLSPLQRAYFIGQQTDFDLHVHPHIYFEFEVPEINSYALKTALNRLLARHSILRAKVLPSVEIVIEDSVSVTYLPENDLRYLDLEVATCQLEKIRERLYRANLQADHPPNIYLEISYLKETSRLHLNLDLLFLDGSSVRTILSELSQMYADPDRHWEEKVFELSGYEIYRQQKQSSERYQRTKDYWFKRLETLPGGPLLPLVTNSSLPRRSHLVRRQHKLSSLQEEILNYQAQQKGINLTTLFLTVFSLVVAYWSKDQHFSLTMMVQNRDRDFGDLSGVVSNFASTILVEIDLTEAKSFAEYALEIYRQVFRDVTRSMVCGLDVMQERNRQQGSVFHTASPVAFVSMLSEPCTVIPPETFQLEGENAVFCGLETPQVLLDHQVISRPGGGVSLIWDAMESAFEPKVLDDMFQAYVSLISKVCCDESVWQESYFDFRSSLEEKHHQEYNKTSSLLVKKCLHQYLYEQALSQPDKPFLVTPTQSFTYGEATVLSNQIAWTLRQQYHVKPNELIAVYATKGWEQIIAAQAIMAAGAAYVPIDPNFPESRKLNILKRCGCRLALTHSDYLNDHCLDNLEKIAVDFPDTLVAKEENLPLLQSPHDLAYVIFTSGSTGEPKGVMLDHLGPVNTITDINHRFNIRADDKIFGISELTFDLSVYDIFGTIAAGATLILPPAGANRDPSLCAQLCEQQKVTIWNSVPALAQLLVEYFESNSLVHQLSIRLFMMSGDWIPVQLPEKLKRLFSAQTVSLGGATEASIWSIYYDIEEVNPSWNSIPYGYPLTNQTFHVLDSKKQPRPDNVPGELYIGGVGVAQGYWQDSLKTELSYVVHPMSKERIYRTGDWGVRRPTGYLEFLGREDGQVKVRGYRIELGEIESVLQRHPQVTNAVAKVLGDQPQATYIAAYIIAKDGEDLSWQELQEYLADFLPEYMIPSRFIFVNQFPLGATGKVNRKALPIPTDYNHAKVSEPPCTETEKKLAQLWAEILKIENPMRQDNFFDVGGNSFSAVRLIALINDCWSIHLPITALLQHPTLEKIAQLLDIQSEGHSLTSHTHLVSFAPENTQKPIFWFHPSGGGVLCYQDLGRALAEQFHLYGIQASTAILASHQS
ncbi:MAG: amino acid adenylation domain-containing protein [Microcystaceae cyanobacterium]